MPIGVYIEYEAQPGKFDELLQCLRVESETCLREDHGCLRMELSIPQPPDGWVVLSELWQDQQAITAHQDKPGHSHDWQIPLVARKRVRVCTVIERGTPG
ncbi:antibiotic biosynthesis monooxygenase family protein [Roseateles toxinivorans]|uniref:Quinol monooxygenase YgiN n=1 Tax=Roseateles toxinivorans TaxID=270368 RepID=A0A4R6QIP2_9BURK|nr:antibiotic biosynthesis monooxygenase [Roseateles toxinivorans]TDP62058.1 quinol monooxygenase YgiN [Roseateles toxinivorans]